MNASLGKAPAPAFDLARPPEERQRINAPVSERRRRQYQRRPPLKRKDYRRSSAELQDSEIVKLEAAYLVIRRASQTARRILRLEDGSYEAVTILDCRAPSACNSEKITSDVAEIANSPRISP